MFKITVNSIITETSENKSLLRYLRDDLKITSAKDGCSEGACGTCTILYDGEAVKACTLTTKMADGHSVITVEGLSEWEKRVYDYSFGKAGAVQCGFCIPGMVMAAKGLLDKTPDPSEDEIRYAIRNNICRCTGYVKIVEAIRIAATIFRQGELEEEKDEWRIGARVKRPDVKEKVLGYGKYPDDLYVEGMLHAVALRSKHPRARVLSINKDEALKAEGVEAIFTAEDIPGKKTVGHIIKDWEAMIGVGEITRFLGDPIALVVADTREHADKAKNLIKVEYEVLPFIASIEDAKKEDAVLVHPEYKGNIAQERHITRGDAEKAIAESDYTYTAVFTTPHTEHAFLEPECALSMPTEEGVRIYSTDQGVYDTQHETAPMLGLPYDKVEVFNCLIGGGFGGKEDVTVQHLSALAAYLLKKPVKMKLSRSESLLFHPKRHPMREKLTIGVDK
ncbi:MAG: molybdopterin-dependent oxidoreductase, partial [Spirochaetales bacterium]|nr:molybdopterin-dependent oxidoreductase [Spirochaetales bacterium]